MLNTIVHVCLLLFAAVYSHCQISVGTDRQTDRLSTVTLVVHVRSVLEHGSYALLLLTLSFKACCV